MKKLLLCILLSFAGVSYANSGTGDITAFADLLVWHVSQEPESSWANIVSAPGSHLIELRAPNVSFHWNMGFRGGLIYAPADKQLDSSLYWTYFSANTNNNVNISEQLVFPEFFSGFLSNNFFFGGSLNWKFLMNMFDYDIGHKFLIAKSLTLRPAIGIKTGTINQTINADWRADVYTAT